MDNSMNRADFKSQAELYPYDKSIVPKVIYILQFGGIGAIASFLPVYLFDVKGFSEEQVGFMGVLRPAATFLFAPMWTALSDTLGWHRMVYTASTILGTLLRFLLVVVNGFAGLLCMIIAAEGFGSGYPPLVDAAVLAGMSDKKEWGRHRLWGAAGYGIACLVVGFIIQATHSWTGMFVIHGVLMAVTLFTVRSSLRMEPHKDGGSDNSGTRVRTLFFAVVWLCGIGTGVIENFLFLFLQNDLHGPKSLLGLSRYNPWLVCLIEPLHGVTYAVMWNASTSYASDIAPSGLGSTTQGLLASVHWGFGMGSGALVGGFVYQKYGARVMFWGATVLPMVSLVLLACNALFDRQRGGGGQVAYLYKPLQHIAVADDEFEYSFDYEDDERAGSDSGDIVTATNNPISLSDDGGKPTERLRRNLAAALGGDTGHVNEDVNADVGVVETEDAVQDMATPISISATHVGNNTRAVVTDTVKYSSDVTSETHSDVSTLAHSGFESVDGIPGTNNGVSDA